MTRKMKDSGVEWIGMIPDEWRLLKGRYCYDVQSGFPFESDKFSVEKGFPLIRIRDITSGMIETYYDGEFPEEYVVNKGDFLIGMDGDFNVRMWDNRAALLNQRCCRIFEYSGYERKYLFYILPYYLNLVNQLTYSTTVKHLSVPDLREADIPSPTLLEQRRIVRFLDAKCASIDDVIAKTTESIEEYKKLKQAVITEAVTKGVRGKRSMKDSGIDWIGQIPKEWTTSRINRIGKTSSGATPLRSKEKDFFVDADIGWVRSLDLNDSLVYDSDEKITQDALDSSACSIMPIDTVCVAMYGGSGTIGKCGLLKKAMATNQAVCSIVCNKSIILPLFLLYQLICIKPYWMIFAVGTRKDPNINQEIVMKMPVVIPSLDEQREIADYLDKKCAAIDTLISKKQQFIDELTAYKKSLIYEYVTGKKEVPA